MKTQIYNKTVTVPIALDSEQFVSVGAALDMYTIVSNKLRSIDSVSPAVVDVLDTMFGTDAKAFLIATDATGDWSFLGGVLADLVDATNLPYALYDATTFAFAGFYRLDAAGSIVHIAGIDDIEDSKEYVAQLVSDVPVALNYGAMKAQAAYKATISKGVANILTVEQSTDTTTAETSVSITVNSNQYTTELVQFKVATISAKYWKRLQFPFHTVFSGTQYNVGSTVDLTFVMDSEPRYVLVFFKDVYGNISFPFIYVVNA